MAEFTYPGQYFTEKSSGIKGSKTISTSIGCVIGIFPKGDVGYPVLVTSYEEFKSLFYHKVNLYSLKAVKGFYDEGGGSLNVIRVENDTLASAEVSLISDTGFVMKAVANSAGVWANDIKVRITGQEVAASASKGAVLTTEKVISVVSSDGWEQGHRIFKKVSGTYTYLGILDLISMTSTGTTLTLKANSASTVAKGDMIVVAGALVEVIGLDGSVVEPYEKITFEAGTKGYYLTKMNPISQYVDFKVSGSVAPSTTLAKFSYVQAQGTATMFTLASGSDGTYDVDSFTDAISNVLPQISTMANVFTVMEDNSAALTAASSIYNAVAVQCELSRRFFNLIHIPLSYEAISKGGSMTTANGIVAYYNELVSSAFNNIYQGYINTYSEVTLSNDFCPPTGHIAGIWARIATQVGYWQAPAGTDANFRSTNSVSWSLTDLQQGSIYQLGINSIRFFQGYGLLIWGARTNSNNTDFKYCTDRITFTFVEQTILASNLWAVFKPNNPELWSQLGISITMFLTSQWRLGALKGESQSEAFFVNYGSSVTTGYDILQGIVNIEIGLATQKPGEFIHYTISPIISV